jgi:hypothetical protein
MRLILQCSRGNWVISGNDQSVTEKYILVVFSVQLTLLLREIRSKITTLLYFGFFWKFIKPLG